jgi:hypothetical protein
VEGPDGRVRRLPRVVPHASVLALVLYGLAAGILAVTAGSLIGTRFSLLATTLIALAAIRFGDPLLGWLLPLARPAEAQRHS